MLPIKIFLFTLLTWSEFCETNNLLISPNDEEENYSMENEYTIDLKDLLNLGHDPQPLKNPVSMGDSASKFLLQVYNDFKKKQGIEAEDEVEQMIAKHKSHANRFTRSIRDESFITDVDHKLINRCNNIVTFSCKAPGNERKKFSQIHNKYISAMMINFNTNNIPDGMKLVHATFRIYQNPSLGIFEKDMITRKISISVHSKMQHHKTLNRAFGLVNTINSTTSYKGWYEFNITRTLNEWLKHKKTHPLMEPNEILVVIRTPISENNAMNIDANDVGLVKPNVNNDLIAERPFITGYFIGPILLTKIHKIRAKRNAYYKPNPRANQYYRSMIPNIYQLPLSCERINFTLHFKALGMHDWVIAPKNFEAYFCAGQCNFPLSANAKATNHAIVQTLMHLRNPELPKACCVPVKLGSISILHYLDDDAVNLSKYPQSVALECGCH